MTAHVTDIVILAGCPRAVRRHTKRLGYVKTGFFNYSARAGAYLGRALGHAPPLGRQNSIISRGGVLEDVLGLEDTF